MKDYNETRKQDKSIRDNIGYISRREYAEKKFSKTYRPYSMSKRY